MAKKKKYHRIEITPMKSGHQVKVHRGGGMSMMGSADPEEQGEHFSDPKALGDHVASIAAAHDGAEQEPSSEFNADAQEPMKPQKPGRSHMNRMKRPF